MFGFMKDDAISIFLGADMQLRYWFNFIDNS